MTDYRLKAPLSRLPGDTQIFHMKMPHFPELRFEWHPGTRKLYYIIRGSIPEVAEPICELASPEQAQRAAQVWASGYSVGKVRLIGH